MYRSSALTNTRTPRQRSQERGGAAETRVQAHTTATHTPARMGGVQVELTPKHTHAGTPQPKLAERSRDPSTSTPNHTAHPSQE